MKNKGSTNYRALFHDMPRLTGGTDISQNQALAYIAERMECDLNKAKSIYDQIRKPDRKILVFDNITREWMGITIWQQSNTALNVARTANRVIEENGKVLKAILRLLCEQSGKNYQEMLNSDGECREDSESQKEETGTANDDEPEEPEAPESPVDRKKREEEFLAQLRRDVETWSKED